MPLSIHFSYQKTSFLKQIERRFCSYDYRINRHDNVIIGRNKSAVLYILYISLNIRQFSYIYWNYNKIDLTCHLLNWFQTENIRQKNTADFSTVQPGSIAITLWLIFMPIRNCFKNLSESYLLNLWLYFRLASDGDSVGRSPQNTDLGFSLVILNIWFHSCHESFLSSQIFHPRLYTWYLTAFYTPDIVMIF